MVIKMMVGQPQPVMGTIRMAVPAFKNRFDHGHGAAAPAYPVITGLVAFRAAEIQATHVNINFTAWVVKDTAHVGVLDRVSPAAAEMAGPAVFPLRTTHMKGNLDQVNFGIRHTGGRGLLAVGTRGIVADQAVNPIPVGKIKAVVLPAVSGVT